MKQTMQDLIDKLNTWKDDIDCDIKNENNIEDIGKFSRQSISLAMAIGILNGIGDNNNIPKS